MIKKYRRDWDRAGEGASVEASLEAAPGGGFDGHGAAVDGHRLGQRRAPRAELHRRTRERAGAVEKGGVGGRLGDGRIERSRLADSRAVADGEDEVAAVGEFAAGVAVHDTGDRNIVDELHRRGEGRRAEGGNTVAPGPTACVQGQRSTLEDLRVDDRAGAVHVAVVDGRVAGRFDGAADIPLRPERTAVPRLAVQHFRESRVDRRAPDRRPASQELAAEVGAGVQPGDGVGLGRVRGAADEREEESEQRNLGETLHVCLRGGRETEQTIYEVQTISPLRHIVKGDCGNTKLHRLMWWRGIHENFENAW
jgi:hypothetical protein